MSTQCAGAGADIVCGGLGGQESAQAGKRRRPGAQPCNQNATKHGNYRRARLEGRKLALAEGKVMARAAHELGMVAGRCRVRPLRLDQIAILAARRPETLRLAEAVGLWALGIIIPNQRCDW